MSYPNPDHPIEVIVAHNLDAILKMRGLLPDDLVRMVGVRTERIADIRAARVSPTVTEVFAFAQLLGVSPEALLGFETAPAENSSGIGIEVGTPTDRSGFSEAIDRLASAKAARVIQ